jgi:hypothetical protein
VPRSPERDAGVSARVTVQIDLSLADGLSQAAVERGVRAATIDAKGLLVDILSQPGRGRAYTRGTVTHVASAPGAAPAPDTGRLRNSTQGEVFAASDGALGIVSVNTEYAAALELGTEKIAPRPFISRLATDYNARLAAVFARFARLP